MYDRHSLRLVLLSVLALQLLIAGAPVLAGSISMKWDPISHPDLTGYNVYYGTASGSYGTPVSVGLEAETTLNGLDSCRNYYVAIKARGGDGSESETFSNEIAGWARPEVSSASPAGADQGTQLQLVVNGTNFQSGATVRFDDNDITVNDVSVLSCNQLVAQLTIGAGADSGDSEFTVVNPDQVIGLGAGVFNISVATDDQGPEVSDVFAGAVGSTTASISWVTDETADGQVHFRTIGAASYQATPIDADPETDHAILLHGLEPDAEYQFFVRSTDAAGNTTESSTDSFETLPNGFSYLRFEGEVVPPEGNLEHDEGNLAFSGRWIELSGSTPDGTPNNPSGTWDVDFQLPDSGTWYFWYRLYGADEQSDRWLEGVDGNGLDYMDPSEHEVWEWVEGQSHALSPGAHTVNLGGGESNARLDRILITDDADFVPSEQPTIDVQAPGSVLDLLAVAGDAAVSLSWTNPDEDDVARVVIRYRTDGEFPVSAVDGEPLVDRVASANASESFDHTGLTNGTNYRYTVFSVDGSGNASQPGEIQATPEIEVGPLGSVENLVRTDTQ